MARPSTEPPFAKVYHHGLDTIASLSTNAKALHLYLFLVKQCSRANSLVASQDTMSAALGVSKRTVDRATRYLVEKGIIEIARIGTANCYLLDKQDISKTSEKTKHYTGFSTKVLVGTKENPDLAYKLTGKFKPDTQPAQDDSREAA